MKHKLFLLSFLLTLSVIAFGQAEVGEYVPNFNFFENGQKINSRDLSGKVVVISFWASWCGPCQREIVHLQNEVYNKYKDNSMFKLLVIGVGETTSDLNQYKYNNNIYLPMYADVYKRVFNLFGESYFPATYIVNSNNIISYHSTGFNGDLSELVSKLGSLLE